MKNYEIYDDDGYLLSAEPAWPETKVRPQRYDEWPHTYGSIDSYDDALLEAWEIVTGERRSQVWCTAVHEESPVSTDFTEVEPSYWATKIAIAAADQAACEEKAEQYAARRLQRSLELPPHQRGKGYHGGANGGGPHPARANGPYQRLENKRVKIIANLTTADERREARRVKATIEICCKARNCLQQGVVYLDQPKVTQWFERYPMLHNYEHKWFCRDHLHQIETGLELSGLPSVSRLFSKKRSLPVRREELATL